jgi:glycopeptide antibiotics resistance protein
MYLAVLMKLLIFKYPSFMEFEIANGNYLPFRTILIYLSGKPTWTIAIRNIGGNIILFAPIGFLISFFRRPPTWKFVLTAALIISMAIEAVQGALRVGVIDVDDILLNVLGVGFGYAVFLLVVPSFLTHKFDKIT